MIGYHCFFKIINSLSDRKKATRKSLLSQTNSLSSERIDTVTVAQAAVQKAKNALELRKYLDENKTDKDRMEDLRK